MKNIKEDARSLNDDEHLKELVNKVMIRNRRADTGIEWTKRRLKPFLLNFPQENKNYMIDITALKTKVNRINKVHFPY